MDILYKIATDSIHQSGREKVIQSHLRYTSSFNTFDYSEFVRFIVDRYVECYRQNKKFSTTYTRNIIETINRKYSLNTFNSKDIYKIVNNLNKAFNTENKDRIFYTSNGSKMKIDIKSFMEKNIIRSPQFNSTTTSGDGGKLLYDDSNYERVLEYFKNHLNNLLISKKSNPDKMDELALLIVFLVATPRRVSEILGLTIAKCNDLIIRNETTIKSKSGTAIVPMYIPFQFAEILQQYIEKFKEHDDENQLLFTYNYQNMYKTYRKVYMCLFDNREPISRVFHAFRNYFAVKYFIGENQRLTTHALSHTNAKMTAMYANKQKKMSTGEETKKFLTHIYPFPPQHQTSKNDK